MTKTDLLQRIEKMSIAEEQAMPVYSRHMTAILSWSGLSPERRKAVAATLDKLKTESEGHMRELADLSKYVAGSVKDVF